MHYITNSNIQPQPSLTRVDIVDNNYNTWAMTSGKLDVPKITDVFGDKKWKKLISCILNSLPEDVKDKGSKDN